MFWIRSGLQGISIVSEWLKADSAATPCSADVVAMRQALLDALGQEGAACKASLALRIRTAQGAQALWDLRSDVMTVASRLHGEAEGRRRLAGVTALFDGLVPAAAAARKPFGAHPSRPH